MSRELEKERVQTFNEKNIAEFRANSGRVEALVPLVLLTTTGANSGRPRTIPLAYLADEGSDRIYVFASASGSDTDPAWFHNVVAHPRNLTVEIGDETLTADAEILSEPLRSQVYDVQASRDPNFAEYQKRTERPILVVALTLHR